MPQVFAWNDAFLRRGWIKDKKGLKVEELKQERKKALEVLSKDYKVNSINGDLVALTNSSVTSVIRK